MLTGIHFLLTYDCTNECDHCFLFCSPRSGGTFTIAQIETVLDEARRIGSVNRIFFEGGEPFLYYPLLEAGVRAAQQRGFDIGIVTNSYWATSVKDAELWLRKLVDAGLTDISLSEDELHSGEETDERPGNALKAAQNLGLEAGIICIEKPELDSEETQARGEPVVGGNTTLKGRAVDNLTEGLPTKPWQSFHECVHEDFEAPGRVHVDAYGNVHICQGISIGNMWEIPLSELVGNYDPLAHPITTELIKGGPAQLVRKFNLDVEDGYVSDCHLCFTARRLLIDRFPQYLAPRQVYGL
ncbi:radical SAM protein [bacterium]|nr:radical SAM protein [bacterium]